MNGENELPEGWECIKLGDVVSPSKEKIDPKADSTLPYLGLEHIESNSSKIIGHGIAGDAKSTKTVFHEGDVLYGKLRPYLNKVTVPDFDGVCSTDILVFNQNQIINNRYLMRYLSTEKVVEYANLNSKGISLPRVSFHDLAQMPIPLPPLVEQRRIVAAVEALLVRVNASRERLDRVPGFLKAFRQAVLAAACSGRLTEGWREEHQHIEPAIILLKNYFEKNHIEKPKGKSKGKSKFLMDLPNNSHNLPKNWTSSRLKNIIYFAGRIGWRGLKSEEYKTEGPILLAAYNIKENYSVDFTEINHISPERYSESPEIQLKDEDIILVKDGSGIGKIGIIKNLPSEATVNSSLLLIRPSEILVPEFLLFQLSGPEMQRIVKERVTGSATPHLFQRDIKEFEILIPPLPEQHEIVRRVVSLFALADRIEQRVASGKEKADRLTQAILAKAFRGELVPTEAELARRVGREYESAGVLLERIRRERESQGERKPRKRKNRSEKGKE